VGGKRATKFPRRAVAEFRGQLWLRFHFGTAVAEAELPSILGQLWLRPLFGRFGLSAYKVFPAYLGNMLGYIRI
jgi:hypothetical protein